VLAWMQQKSHLLLKVADFGMTFARKIVCLNSNINFSKAALKTMYFEGYK
jgi:hypothetical protein